MRVFYVGIPVNGTLILHAAPANSKLLETIMVRVGFSLNCLAAIEVQITLHQTLRYIVP